MEEDKELERLQANFDEARKDLAEKREQLARLVYGADRGNDNWEEQYRADNPNGYDDLGVGIEGRIGINLNDPLPDEIRAQIDELREEVIDAFERANAAGELLNHYIYVEKPHQPQEIGRPTDEPEPDPEKEIAFRELFQSELSEEERALSQEEKVRLAIERFNKRQEELGSDVRFDIDKHIVEIGEEGIIVLEQYMREKGEKPPVKEPGKEDPEPGKEDPEKPTGEEPAPVGGTRSAAEPEEEFDLEAYRNQVIEQAKRDLRMDHITLRMLEIRSLLENPEANLTTEQRQELEVERAALQKEWSELAGMENHNPSGPDLNAQPLVEDPAMREALNAERDKVRAQLARYIRMNEIRLRMIERRRELDAEGFTGIDPESEALSREFDQLLAESQRENPEIEPVKEPEKEPVKGGTEPEPEPGTSGEPAETDPEKKEEPKTTEVAQTESLIAEREEKLQKLNQEIEAAGKELEELKKKTDVSREELEKLKAEIDSLTQQRDALKAEIAELEKKKAELEGKVTPEDPTKKGPEGPGEGEPVGGAAGTPEGEKEGTEKEGEEPEGGKDTGKKGKGGEGSVRVNGFFANMLLFFINIIRKITGKDTFGEATIQKLAAREAEKALGPSAERNRKDLERLKKDLGAKETEAKKKGKTDDKEVIEEVEDPGTPGATPEGAEEELEGEELVSLAEIDFRWVTRQFSAMATKVPGAVSDLFKKITKEQRDVINGLSDEQVEEALKSDEVHAISDSYEPRLNLLINKVGNDIRERAVAAGIELNNGDEPKSLEELFKELSEKEATKGPEDPTKGKTEEGR